MGSQFKCCGSSNFSDWRESAWIQAEKEQLVPDSCCKTPTEFCGRRDHPSNIYKVEVGRAFHSLTQVNVSTVFFFTFFFCFQGGCIMKLEDFILNQLYILGVVGIGIAFLQVATWPVLEYMIIYGFKLECVQVYNSNPFFLCCFFFQLVGIMFTCCLYRSLKEDPYGY